MINAAFPFARLDVCTHSSQNTTRVAGTLAWERGKSRIRICVYSTFSAQLICKTNMSLLT